jgi:archaeosine synthase
MSGGQWSYRIELVDGPSRAGSIERDGKKLRLPALIDIIPGSGGDVIYQRLHCLDPSWSDLEIGIAMGGGDGGPWEDHVKAFLRKKGLDRLLPGVEAMRHVINADGEALPLKVPGLMHLLYPDAREFSSALASAKGDWPSGAPLYLPGITDGDNIESLLYLGIELHDASCAHTDASEGIYYTNEGREPLLSLKQRVEPSQICDCPECRSGVPDAASLGRHNVSMLMKRMAISEMMLREGRLRSHMMGKLSGKPALAALVRRMENGPSAPDLGHTYRKDMVRPVTYRDDMRDPDFRLWAKRVQADYRPHPGRKVMLLLPCSARKPYSASRTHQRIRGYLASVKGWRDVCQQVVVTSPLGAVPMELDHLYPPAYYDIPVTGEWYPEEISLMRELVRSIASTGCFTDAVCFHPEGAGIFEEEVRTGRMGDMSFTIASDEAALRSCLQPLVERYGGSSPRSEPADICSLLRFSFGADIPWDTALRIRRSQDRSDIYLDRSHIAELKKGGPIPSLEGGRILWEKGWGRRVIIDDFIPKGTVFTQGVLRTEGRVRIGDIVLVGTENEFRGIGRAVIPGSAMSSGARGNAVRMVSHVKG